MVLFFLRDQEVMGTAISLAQLGIPGMLAMTLISSGVLGVAGQLVTERDDGTLLRAKATPHGMLSHLLGNVLIFTGTSLGPVLALLLAAAASCSTGSRRPTPAGGSPSPGSSLLGLFATLPLGALIGALLRAPVMLAWASLIVYGAMAISGHLLPDRRPARLAAGDRPGAAHLLARAGAARRRCCRRRPSPSSSGSPGTCGRPSPCWVPGSVLGLVLAPMRAAPDGAQAVGLAGGRRAGPRDRPGILTAMSEQVHNRIAMLRAERGVSRRDLAEALGVHYQTVGYLERGEYAPSLYLALRIAAYFDVPVEIVFSTEPFPLLGSGNAG